MNELTEDEFFIIDSDNLNQVSQRFYGYAITRDGAVSTEIDEKEPLSPEGAYIFIDVGDNEISIYQDFIGSYGLYLFKKDDYFAISNSFIKLVDYVKLSNEISYNKDYANDLIVTSLTTHSYGATLVNEIELLPRNYVIRINRKNKSLEFEEIDYGENTVSIDSAEGIRILDDWYHKWVNIIRKVKGKTNNLCVHLSGGFDSRIVAALWLSANINLDDVKVVSVEDDKHNHKQDYEIASQISGDFGFKLNEGKMNESSVGMDDLETCMMNSFNLKLGFHKEMYFKTFRYEEPVYSVTGSGGEVIRGNNISPSYFISDMLKNVSGKDYALIKSSLKILEDSFSQVSERFDLDRDSSDLLDVFYREVRCRHHFGKSGIETFLSNEISLTPLIDSDLYRLKLNTPECENKMLLMALIIDRYCPELLDYRIEGNRKFSDEAIEHAKIINSKYLFVPKEFDDIPTPEANVTEMQTGQNSIKRKDIDGYLERVFNSRAFEMEFTKYFSFKTYDEIYDVAKNTDYYPLKSVYSAIAVLKVIKDVEISRYERDSSEITWLDSFLNDDYARNIMKHENKADLMKYATAFILVKNVGGRDNMVEFIKNSDDYAHQYAPDWFVNDEGYGWVIESFAGSLDLEIRCIKDGMLNVILKSLNFTDKYGKFPLYINYRSLVVDGENHIVNKVVWHDSRYLFEKEVHDGDIVKIHIEWTPINGSSVYINKLELVNRELVRKNKELTSKLNELGENHEKP